MEIIGPERGKSYGVQHILAPRSGLVVDLLCESTHLDSTEALRLLNLGAIYHNHSRLVCAESFAKEGDYLRAHCSPRRFPVEQLNWPTAKVFENQEFLVVNKPSGLPVHPTVDNRRENLLSLLKTHLNEDLYITHRLDVPTSGLLVYAKTVEFQKRFNKWLTLGEVAKTYRCLVHGSPATKFSVGQELIHYMQPSPKAPKVLSAQKQDDWQECRLKILQLKQLTEEVAELQIRLLTGRTHQIRAQLSCEGFPLVGDGHYGSPLAINQRGFDSISLCAEELQFGSGSQQYRFWRQPNFANTNT